jgi:hypothetical protein
MEEPRQANLCSELDERCMDLVDQTSSFTSILAEWTADLPPLRSRTTGELLLLEDSFMASLHDPFLNWFSRYIERTFLLAVCQDLSESLGQPDLDMSDPEYIQAHLLHTDTWYRANCIWRLTCLRALLGDDNALGRAFATDQAA